MKCQLCNNEVKNYLSLTMHLRRSHKNISLQDYYDQFIIDDINNSFCICDRKKKFTSLEKGYAKTCGDKNCINTLKSITAKQTFLKNWGVEHPMKVNSVKEKLKNSLTDENGNYRNNRNKAKQTCRDRYGVDNPTQMEDYNLKVKNTCMKKYGVEHHTKSQIIQDKKIETCLDKYGVDNVFQSEEIKEKIKQTLIKNYGVDHASKNLLIKEKINNSFIERHGRKWGQFTDEQREKSRRYHLDKKYNEILSSNKYNTEVSPLFTIDEYIGNNVDYDWKCLKCGNIFEDNLTNCKVPRCPICHPKLYGMSNGEKELFNFLSQYIICEENKQWRYDNNKRWHELDIFIPSLNIGIEYNGVYYHSENTGGCHKYKHRDKTEFFADLGIQIFHITDIEWENKKEIIKSILLSKIGKNKDVIYARKCKLQEVNSKDARKFLNDNHLQGYSNCSYRYGLYHENELVSIMTLGKSRFDKKYDYELLRFSNKLETTIVGGFAKLLKHFRKFNIGTIISYADKRYSDGGIYYNNNFSFVKDTVPNYWYFTLKKFDGLYNRINFQKHKLSGILNTFDPNITEWENMKNNKYDRIWDCGNLVFELL